jgi:hypothetical protein
MERHVVLRTGVLVRRSPEAAELDGRLMMHLWHIGRSCRGRPRAKRPTRGYLDD